MLQLFHCCIKYRHRVQNATKNSIASQVVLENYKYEQIRNCVIIHDEAIQFVFIE